MAGEGAVSPDGTAPGRIAFDTSSLGSVRARFTRG
jgi:hypothetical protein